MAQSAHLEELARVGSFFTRLELLRLINGPSAGILIGEPHKAIALTLLGSRVFRRLHRVDLSELTEDQVQIFSSDGLIQTSDAHVALEV